MTTIIDAGFGNTPSIARMVQRVGGEPFITRDPADLANATRLILSGVGSFDYAMGALDAGGWIDPLRAAVETAGTPILGICLGMQILADSSEEGDQSGLGWVPGRVVRLAPADPSLPVPHMGWNTIDVVRDGDLLQTGGEEQRFYFVHSYQLACRDESDVVATAEYGGPVVAAVQRGHILGVQFHPEKSHRFGMRLLERFIGG